MAVAVIVAMATIQSTQASIDYWLENPQSFAPGLNHITIYARNGGGMDGDFNLILKFSNAKISCQTELPYTNVTASSISIKFVLHRDNVVNRTVYFETVSGADVLSVTVSLEKTSLVQFLKANQLFPTQMSFQWNAKLQVFNCTSAQ